jgi:hypothetical protein
MCLSRRITSHRHCMRVCSIEKAFVFNDLAPCLVGAGRGHVGGVRYTYIHSYTHGVKLNVNPINITITVRFLCSTPYGPLE